MKTTSFRTAVLGTPWRNLTYVFIETDEGLTGVGEARVLGKTHTVGEYLRDVQRHFIGHDPFNIEALYRRMTLLDFGKPGEVVYTGLALVELAFWDIIGKACGQPVYRLLAGRPEIVCPHMPMAGTQSNGRRSNLPKLPGGSWSGDTGG